MLMVILRQRFSRFLLLALLAQCLVSHKVRAGKGGDSHSDDVDQSMMLQSHGQNEVGVSSQNSEEINKEPAQQNSEEEDSETLQHTHSDLGSITANQSPPVVNSSPENNNVNFDETIQSGRYNTNSAEEIHTSLQNSISAVRLLKVHKLSTATLTAENHGVNVSTIDRTEPPTHEAIASPTASPTVLDRHRVIISVINQTGAPAHEATASPTTTALVDAGRVYSNSENNIRDPLIVGACAAIVALAAAVEYLKRRFSGRGPGQQRLDNDEPAAYSDIENGGTL